ncbi:MAG TPA: hypothetical protein VF916_02525 [Ktedonobacterales bacterium]
MSSSGRWAFCTREEFAGDLELSENTTPPTYKHRLDGTCGCNAEHRPTERHAEHANDGASYGVSGYERRFRLYDADGALVGVHVRIDYRRGDGAREKRLYWEQHNGRRSVDMPLYNLPELLMTPKGSPVYVTEGESACESLTMRGVLAVGTVTGAHAIPCDASLSVLGGYDVIL